MQALIAFAHGMANFAHNRLAKADQERLIRTQLSAPHKFLGAFDDSGNFAFVTLGDSRDLQAKVLAALRLECEVEGVVVIERARAVQALAALERIATVGYGDKFQSRDYTVLKDRQRWRLGFVFMDHEAAVNSASVHALHDLRDEHMEFLSLQGGIVGVLKFDPRRPRIPWGEPARTVASAVAASTSRLVATGRSARTVRGVLQKFTEESSAQRSGMSVRRVFSGAEWEKKVGYCRAVLAGSHVFVSGTAPVAPGGGIYALGDAYRQARRCFEIIDRALQELGISRAAVTRTRMFVTDIARWAEFGRAHAEFFGAAPPATTMVEVRRLIAEDMLIEVEADAVILPAS